MAFVIRFNLVIVRKQSIEARYPGGLLGFRSQWAGRRQQGRGAYAYREDEHLVGLSYMGCYEAELVKNLTETGLSCSAGSEDVAYGDQTVGLNGSCTWLDQGECKGLPTCWLKGSEPGTVIDFGPGTNTTVQA